MAPGVPPPRPPSRCQGSPRVAQSRAREGLEAVVCPHVGHAECVGQSVVAGDASSCAASAEGGGREADASLPDSVPQGEDIPSGAAGALFPPFPLLVAMVGDFWRHVSKGFVGLSLGSVRLSTLCSYVRASGFNQYPLHST